MRGGRTSLGRGGAARRLVELCGAGLDSVAFRRQLRRELEGLVPFDAYCVNTVDPTSLLITSSIGDGLSAAAARRWFELEESGEDFNRLTELARGEKQVRSVAQATSGDVSRSARMRELFGPMGLRDELRAALVVDGHCWGYLQLFRREPFTNDELLRIRKLQPLLASALRAACVVGESAAGTASPAVLVLSPGTELLATGSNAAAWLSDLAGDVGGSLPHPLLATATRTQQRAPASGSYRTPTGRWIHFSGAPLGMNVALVLSTPATRQLGPLWCLAHGLSARQRQICELLLEGYSNDAIAASLGIKLFTVKDHVKQILSKTRAPTRATLLAALYV